MTAQGGQGQASGGAGLLTFAPLIFLFIIFYFLLIRPQQKRQKQTQQMLAQLGKGDNIITSGGLFGTIAGIKNDKVVVKIAENVKVEVLKSAISSVVIDEKK